jgi:hypothetical protein
MGVTTDFVGHLNITPGLNDAEVEYLTAFGLSRRCGRPGGPYEVPGNPRAESSEDFPGDTYNTPSAGQPQLWCDWAVCWDGCCLTWSGKEKSYQMTAWLRYLITHFLKPGAKALGERGFEEFTFDHVVDGQVVGCRRDNKELFTIVVSNNRVSQRILKAGDPRLSGYPPLPYEQEIDYWAKKTRRRRRRRGADNVVELPAAGC